MWTAVPLVIVNEKDHGWSEAVYLIKHFVNKIIGYVSVENYLPSSPDETPLGFYVWGYLKQQLLEISPQTLQNLKICNTEDSANVSRSMLKRVKPDIQTRTQTCIAADVRSLNISDKGIL